MCTGKPRRTGNKIWLFWKLYSMLAHPICYFGGHEHYFGRRVS